jgi:hypothetical protein
MDIVKFMIKEGVIKGNGKDSIGEFDINGYERDSEIRFNKKYIGQHQVAYVGTLVGKRIQGQWSIND